MRILSVGSWAGLHPVKGTNEVHKNVISKEMMDAPFDMVWDHAITAENKLKYADILIKRFSGSKELLDKMLQYFDQINELTSEFDALSKITSSNYRKLNPFGGGKPHTETILSFYPPTCIGLFPVQLGHTISTLYNRKDIQNMVANLEMITAIFNSWPENRDYLFKHQLLSILDKYYDNAAIKDVLVKRFLICRRYDLMRRFYETDKDSPEYVSLLYENTFKTFITKEDAHDMVISYIYMQARQQGAYWGYQHTVAIVKDIFKNLPDREACKELRRYTYKDSSFDLTKLHMSQMIPSYKGKAYAVPRLGRQYVKYSSLVNKDNSVQLSCETVMTKDERKTLLSEAQSPQQREAIQQLYDRSQKYVEYLINLPADTGTQAK